MKKQNYTEDNYNIIQVVMKSQECKFVLPKDHKVFCFLAFMKGLDLNKYLKKEKDSRGRKSYDLEVMLQIILYAYIDEGQVSYSNLEKFCEERTPYMLIANGEMPSANCFCSFVNEYLLIRLIIFSLISFYV